jgi:tRNA-(ms[2]io[6]A)-hydroxylase
MFLKFARQYGDNLKEVNEKWQDLLVFEANIMKSLSTSESIHG